MSTNIVLRQKYSDVFLTHSQTEVEFHPTDSWVLTLNKDEHDAIQQITNQFAKLEQLPVDDPSFFTQIELLHKDVPRRIAQTLIEFRKYSNAYGTLLLKNLPVDSVLPPTPPDGRSQQKSTFQSECNLLLLMSFLGDPIAYADEKEGALIQNICPVAGQEGKQENTGSVFLEFHTEDGFHPHKPDYLGLFCLRPDQAQQARTATASVLRAIDKVSSSVIALLRQPLFHIRLSSSFLHNKDAKTLYSHPLPVLSGDILEPDLCIDFHAMEGVNPVATAALDLFKLALEQVLIGCVLVPGDLIIVDNRTAAHARTGFKPLYDGEDRWLQRLFIVRDFRLSRKSRLGNGHICTPLNIEFTVSNQVTLS